MKRTLSLLLALLILLTCAGMCAFAESQTGVLYQAGTYVGESTGFLGEPIIVETVFSDDRIESITVVQCLDSDSVCKPAVEQIPARILEHQSLAVDVMTGCTVTSRSILSAVSSCANQAGADMKKLQAALPAADMEEISVSADVAVVGGGISGLSAAARLADKGKTVVLFEKLSTLGGNANLSGGFMLAWGGALHDAAGITDTSESVFAQWETIRAKDSLRENTQVDPEAWRQMIEGQPEAINFLLDHGAEASGPMQDMLGYWGEPPRWIFGGQFEEPANKARGTEFTNGLIQHVLNKNITIYYNCPVTSITHENGVVNGVIAQGKAQTVTCSAKNVILATGGYSHNSELLSRFIPELNTTFGAWSLSLPSSTGDGISMAEEIGADVYDIGWVCDMSGLSVQPGHYAAGINLISSNLMIDGLGNMVEFKTGNIGLDLMNAYNSTGSVRYILDADSATAPVCEQYLHSANILKANSLDELASLMAVDADALEASIAAYHENSAERIDTAPYYGVSGNLKWFETIGGIKTNDAFQALNTDGAAIDGLYAVGALTNGKYFNQTYPGGSMILLCTHSGLTAAESILSAEK